MQRFWGASIGFLMISMLLSIIVGEQSYQAGVRSLLDIDPQLNVAYSALKIIFGIIYLKILRVSWYEAFGIIAFALLVRLFAEGTFTIALIGAMMGRRVVK